MSIQEEITELTAKWFKYVNLDHHKDRDCHWYITQTYSYGEEPYYEAHHSGYILDHWTSPRCSTEEMASIFLRDKLKRELHGAVIHLESIASDQDTLDWLGHPKQKILDLIEELR